MKYQINGTIITLKCTASESFEQLIVNFLLILRDFFLEPFHSWERAHTIRLDNVNI